MFSTVVGYQFKEYKNPNHALYLPYQNPVTQNLLTDTQKGLLYHKKSKCNLYYKVKKKYRNDTCTIYKRTAVTKAQQLEASNLFNYRRGLTVGV